MIKFLLGFIVCGMLAFNANAQDYAQKTQEIDSLLELSYQAVVDVDMNSSLNYALLALSASKEIDFSEGKSKACFYSAQALFYLGVYKEALEYLALAEQENYTTENAHILSELCRVRGRIYASMGLKVAAEEEFKNGLGHIREIDGPATQEYLTSLAYDNLTNTYKIWEKTDSMFAYIQKNRALLENMEESFCFRNKVNLYGTLGDYYTNKEQFDSAAYYFNQALLLARKYEYPYTSMVFQYLGDMEFKKQNIDSSLFYYMEALKNLEQTEIINEFPGVYSKIALVYTEKGIADSAHYYQGKALLLENEISNEKIAASEIALQQILNREIAEREAQKQRRYYLLALGVFSLILTLSVAYLVVLRKKHRLIEEKEREAERLKGKLNEAFDEVLALARQNDPAFLPRFQEVYPEFCRSLLQKHPDIVHTEFSFCAMIFLNFTSKEIAQYTFIEHRSVQTKKTRLRKKLGVPSEVDLYQYLQSLA